MPVVPVRLAAKQVKKSPSSRKNRQTRRARGRRPLDGPARADRHRLRQSSGLAPHAPTGRQGAVDSAIRVVAADERVKVTQSAVMRAPSVETEVNALRAEEEQAEAMAAYEHHHLKPPKSL
jgi:hypothetical protein